MYPSPTGSVLTAEQCQALDDTFLSSDPFEYFSVRIGMILQWADSNGMLSSFIAPAEDKQNSSTTGEQFSRLLGRPVGFLPTASSRSITTQIATDAYALRHHAAESLVRLTAVVMSQTDDSTTCLWEALSNGTNQLDRLVGQLEESISSPNARLNFARSVLRDQDLQGGMTEELASVSNVFADWLQFSIGLLTGNELQLNAAHNKVKHGLSVRARDDLKVSLATAPPNADGTIPVSALTGPNVLDIFDRPVIEVLAQAPKVNGHRQGMELTQLRVDAPAILAEAYMIAWAHGAMFHIAATKHFAKRPELPDYLQAPAHPGYPLGGPRPEHISAKTPVGMRFPLTTPPGGGPIQRPAGIAFHDMFVPLQFTGSEMRNIRVVADAETGA